MKVLFVGDVHNHSYMFNDMERLDKEHNFDKIIFTGDYVDDWNTTNSESLETLNRIIELKKCNSNKYTFILGNHELSYLGYPCAGHRYEKDIDIEQTLKENIEYFDLYNIIELDGKEYISTHAGITNSYINGVISKVVPGLKTNDWKQGLEIMNKYKLDSLGLLKYVSCLRGGYNEYSSMVWCDKREHEYFGVREKYWIPYQIVGHTPVKTISNLSDKDSIIYFIDTHSTYRDGSQYGDKSYLFWNEKEFEILY